MKPLSTCKHCQFQWTKGTDSGHSVEDCRDRLKAESERLELLVFEVWSGTDRLNKDLINEIGISEQWNASYTKKRLNLTTEQGESE